MSSNKVEAEATGGGSNNVKNSNPAVAPSVTNDEGGASTSTGNQAAYQLNVIAKVQKWMADCEYSKRVTPAPVASTSGDSSQAQATTSDVPKYVCAISKEGKLIRFQRSALMKGSLVAHCIFTDLEEAGNGDTRVVNMTDVSGNCLKLLAFFMESGTLPSYIWEGKDADLLEEIRLAANMYLVWDLMQLLDKPCECICTPEEPWKCCGGTKPELPPAGDLEPEVGQSQPPKEEVTDEGDPE